MSTNENPAVAATNPYRLTSVTYPGPTTHTYTYDALGNRLTKGGTSYTYDDADQMTAAGGVTHGYDSNGNQTSRGTDTFTFDHENRMTQSVVGGATSSSVYYGDGVRRSHTVSGTTTTYQYDVLGSLPVVIQDGTYSYVYGLDLISMTDGAGSQTYFSYDGLGSVSDLTDGTGTVTDTFVYDVFGAVTTQTGTTATAWKFTGEQADDGTGDSGYYFLRARHYDQPPGGSSDATRSSSASATHSGTAIRLVTSTQRDYGASIARSGKHPLA